MYKYKVGDRVLIIKVLDNTQSHFNEYIGNEAIIAEQCKNMFVKPVYRLEMIPYLWFDEELKLVTETQSIEEEDILTMF